MSAETLRRAAEKLREQASAARDITGASDWFMECRGMHFTGEYGVRSSGGFVAGDTVEEEAAYIATMRPDVGLALADWLDDCASRFGKPGHREWHGNESSALAVARAILGGDS